jgi:glycyl-tRNA synthetase beta chain
MSELLLELFSEEIPAMMQGKAASAYEDIFRKYFAANKIAFQNIEVHVGPRRLCVYVNGIPSVIPSATKELKGPKCSAPDAAIEGFCRSNKITKDKLETKEINDADFYVYIQRTDEQKTQDILLKNIGNPISEYVWPKSMYWGDYKIKWVRPLQNILCIFGGKVVPFEYGHLKANNLCFGHRFMSPDSAKVNSFDEYKKHLSDNFVVLDADQRSQIIKDGLKKAALDLGLVIKDDPYLIEEVSGLAEYPRVLVGKIEERFLSVPSEVLVSAMRSHQKYFSVFDQDGNFAPYFVFVSNIKSEEESLVISGNEKVLSARLADALYFYNQDLKTSLLEKANRLDNVIFHAKLGSLKDKTARLSKLSSFIDADDKEAAKAALICKSDIVSEVVDEFPTLQGIMGHYYALAESGDSKVALAIRDHYKPQGPADECPKGAAAILALADKMDSLCGLMLAGEKPSGSKDPFALRRQALGIVRIILENELDIDLVKLVKYSLGLYKVQIEVTEDCKDQILKFLEERIRYFFKSKYSLELIEATLDLSRETSLVQLESKLKVLNYFIVSKQGEDLLLAYKRANNLLGKAKIDGNIDETAFISIPEKELFACINVNKVKIESALNKKDYKSGLELLASFHEPLSNFFENILVKDKNESIAKNRMLLLEQIRAIFNQIAKFDKL